MEENKNLWNKTADELTVGDIVKVNLAVPAIMVGGFVALNVGVKVWDYSAGKVQLFKQLRQQKNQNK